MGRLVTDRVGHRVVRCYLVVLMWRLNKEPHYRAKLVEIHLDCNQRHQLKRQQWRDARSSARWLAFVRGSIVAEVGRVRSQNASIRFEAIHCARSNSVCSSVAGADAVRRESFFTMRQGYRVIVERLH
ncbi:hypothetical protein RB13173 [Rhodopirellula baltica SH 1]|uniref:Uncharacterized protein n=1 Tax=Rhodopirellula baltica (strain DSM 10527 / NCIMB 13988 / SH1) TaxID=243090 RepID=Q7UHI7_RHOBA|nr:hypothetical protein RB13173 [Rhodopirellula baltica SH 1]